MPISDLTNTTWLLNETVTWINTSLSGTLFNINFVTNSQNCSRLYFENVNGDSEYFVLYYYPIASYWNNPQFDGDYDTPVILTWRGEPAWSIAYRTITITGGTDVTNADLIAWLEANAEQVVEPAAATFSSFKDISYNAATKALTINGVSYTLAATAAGTTVAGGSFSQLTLTSEGVLSIDGVNITLPVYVAPAPDHSIVDNTGGYILDNSTGYLITTERSTILTAPTISLADTTLSIVDEDGRSMTYDIYVDDAFARNIEAVTGSTTTFDLENLGLGVGAHIIKAKAKASSLGDSNYSNEVTYTLAGDVILDQFTLPNNITDFEFIYDA